MSRSIVCDRCNDSVAVFDPVNERPEDWARIELRLPVNRGNVSWRHDLCLSCFDALTQWMRSA